jgi:hypothetical protein
MNQRYAAYALALGLLLYVLIVHATPGPSESQDATAVFAVA